MDVFQLHRGNRPLLISLPHDGTEVPPGFAVRMTPVAARLPDTDWHVGRLYAFAGLLGASVIRPRFSRYLIDLNRAPDDAELYPGRNTTGLCPVQRFDGGPVYRDGCEPDAGERRHRVETYWRPYHEALAAEVARLRQAHGRAVLWEGHSIRGQCPFLFDGVLPDINLGTAGGASCTEELRGRLLALLSGQTDYTWVADGRFKGGYITRHYGRPADGVEAIQLEIAQRSYLNEADFEYLDDRAERLQALLHRLLEACL